MGVGEAVNKASLHACTSCLAVVRDKIWEWLGTRLRISPLTSRAILLQILRS